MKQEFEQHSFLVGSMIYHIHSDSHTEYMKINDAKIRYAPLKVDVWNNEAGKIFKENFLDLWIEDKNRKAYERVDFFPNVEMCPKDVFNLFKGFKAEQYKPETPLTDEEIETLVEPIVRHVNYLTKGYAVDMLKWQSNIIQNPDKKSEIGILIRDEGDFMKEGGGTGKNLYFDDYFAKQIIGEEYCITVGDNKELYTNFNSLFEGKLLVFVEEACSKDNHGNNDVLKSKITSKKSNINKKMQAQYTVNDYSNYIFTCNNRIIANQARKQKILGV